MKKPHIVFLDTETVGVTDALKKLEQIGQLTVYPVTLPDQRIDHIGDHEVVITNKVMIDQEVMDACPALRLICIAATGMNNVDLDAAKAKGIQVINVAGYSTESVVQHTFALLFNLLNQLDYYSEYVRSGSYVRSGLFTHHGRPFFELSGKIVGIIGLGTIGERVAGVAASFGARVRYYSTTGKNLNQIFELVSLEVLLQESDVISIHCPLNDQTRNLLGPDQLKQMKKEAILINTGRGGIVDEVALAYALDHNLIRAAGLDVLSAEPPDAGNPLLHIRHKEKLLITPHIAWASVESRNRLIEGIIRNIEEYLDKQ